jgi:hypothetical protein
MAGLWQGFILGPVKCNFGQFQPNMSMEEHILDNNAGKQLSQAAIDF